MTRAVIRKHNDTLWTVWEELQVFEQEKAKIEEIHVEEAKVFAEAREAARRAQPGVALVMETLGWPRRSRPSGGRASGTRRS